MCIENSRDSDFTNVRLLNHACRGFYGAQQTRGDHKMFHIVKMCLMAAAHRYLIDLFNGR